MESNNINGNRLDGEWWLPSSPDLRVAGSLDVSLEGRSALHLIGALGHGDNPRATRSPDEEALSLIWGQVGNKCFTLERCFQTHFSGSLAAGPVRQSIHVNRVLAGAAWFHEPIDFHEIEARMDGLLYWVARTGVSETEGWDSDLGRMWFELRLEHLPKQESALYEDGTIEIGHTWAITGDLRSSRAFEQDFTARLSWPSRTTLNELQTRLGALQDLVSVALQRPATFRRVQVRDRDVTHRQAQQEEERPHSFDVVANWTVRGRPDARPLNATDPLFTLDDLGGLPSVARWMQIARTYRGPLSRVMATQYSPDMYVSDRLMNCAAAVERYDKRKNGSASPNKHGAHVTFKEQVVRCAAYAGPEFAGLVGDLDAWGATFKNHRTDVAHHLERGEDAPSDALAVSQAAYWMFLFCLFRDCDMPAKVFASCAASSDWLWLRRRLRSEGIVTDT